MPSSALLMLILIVAIGLAFDFINGFHDTANAIATSVATRVRPRCSRSSTGRRRRASRSTSAPVRPVHIRSFTGPNANLPFANATATISDSLKFCVSSGCAPVNLGAIALGPSPLTLKVTVNYNASLASHQNGENIGAALGTGVNFYARYDSVSSEVTGLVHQGSPDFYFSNTASNLNIPAATADHGPGVRRAASNLCRLPQKSFDQDG